MSTLREPPDDASQSVEGYSGEPAAGDVLASEQYLAVSAAMALLHYATTELGIAITPKTLKVEGLKLESHMRLDLNTITSLELVRSQGRPLAGERLQHQRPETHTRESAANRPAPGACLCPTLSPPPLSLGSSTSLPAAVPALSPCPLVVATLPTFLPPSQLMSAHHLSIRPVRAVSPLPCRLRTMSVLSTA